MNRADFGVLLGAAMGEMLRQERGAHMPEGAQFVWEMFLDLNETRTVGPHGQNPISFTEIEAYLRLMRWPAAPHQVDMIRALDRAWMAHVRKQMAAGAGKVASQNLTAAAFDAVF